MTSGRCQRLLYACLAGLGAHGIAHHAHASADQRLLALASWSLAHGVSELLLNGKIGEIASAPDAAVDLARRIVGVLDYGLQPRGDAE